jgi:AcrR family transcriptional regulator
MLPTPVSRRERPAKPALTREGIIQTAVTVMRTEGLERVTMRRLATELDTGPASFYVYVRNTAELHAAVLDELLGLVGLVPIDASQLWTDNIVTVLASYMATLVEHPGLARSALVTRPSGPNYLALAERLLSLLRGGGIPDSQSAWGVDLLLLFATSIALEHGTRGRASDSDEEQDALAHALHQADPNVYPSIAAVGDELLSGTPQARFDWHVRVILAGIATTARPQQANGQAQGQDSLHRHSKARKRGRSRPVWVTTGLTPLGLTLVFGRSWPSYF